jgi:hypothetical protein
MTTPARPTRRGTYGNAKREDHAKRRREGRKTRKNAQAKPVESRGDDDRVDGGWRLDIASGSSHGVWGFPPDAKPPPGGFSCRFNLGGARSKRRGSNTGVAAPARASTPAFTRRRRAVWKRCCESGSRASDCGAWPIRPGTGAARHGLMESCRRSRRPRIVGALVPVARGVAARLFYTSFNASPLARCRIASPSGSDAETLQSCVRWNDHARPGPLYVSIH